MISTENMNKSALLVHNLLENSAKLFPHKTACVHGTIRATYEQINQRANRLAHWMIESGIKSGDRVVIVIENSVEYIIGYYGALKSGAVFISLPTGIKHDGILPLLVELEPQVLITSSHRTDLCSPNLIDQTTIKHLIVIGENTHQKYKHCNLYS